MSKPDITAVLDAAHLEELENQHLAARIVAQEAGGEVPAEAGQMELPGLTLATVQEAFRRIAYHQRQREAVILEVQAAVAALQAQIDQLQAYANDQATQRDRSIEFHKQRLVAYFQLNPPAKGKTLKLPGGLVARKDPARQWKWQDEAALLVYLQASGAPAVRTPEPAPPPMPTVDKAAFKKWARIDESTSAVINPETGEVIPGVLTEQPQSEYVVELAQG